MNKTDPTGLYDCGTNTKCETAQNTAINKISGTMGELKGLQKTLAAGDKLSASQQKLSDKVSKELGHGAGTNSKAIDGLLGVGNKMLGVLKGNAPVTIASSGTAYANTANGGVTLQPNFFSSSPQMQASTMAHESAHLGAQTWDPPLSRNGQSVKVYGETEVANYATWHSTADMLYVTDAVTLSLGVDRDDGYK